MPARVEALFALFSAYRGCNDITVMENGAVIELSQKRARQSVQLPALLSIEAILSLIKEMQISARGGETNVNTGHVIREIA